MAGDNSSSGIGWILEYTWGVHEGIIDVVDPKSEPIDTNFITRFRYAIEFLNMNNVQSLPNSPSVRQCDPADWFRLSSSTIPHRMLHIVCSEHENVEHVCLSHAHAWSILSSLFSCALNVCILWAYGCRNEFIAVYGPIVWLCLSYPEERRV